MKSFLSAVLIITLMMILPVFALSNSPPGDFKTLLIKTYDQSVAQLQIDKKVFEKNASVIVDAAVETNIESNYYKQKIGLLNNRKEFSIHRKARDAL